MTFATGRFRIAPLLVVVLTGACASSSPVAIAPNTAFKPGQHVEVWHAGERSTLHEVRVGGDSLSGVPASSPAACDSCRVAFPLAAVDSARVVHGDKAVLLGFGLVFAAAAVVLLVWNLTDAD